MVRAAASGAFNYANADPYNSQWQLRHSLILREVVRQEDIRLIIALQQHWLSYVSHSRLEEGSWDNAKNNAANALTQLSNTIYPWHADTNAKSENSTINNKYADLIARYRQMIADNTQNSSESS